MNLRKELGNTAENLAAEYLTDKGYRIIHKNYRAGHSEVDLICSKDTIMVFVEVKFRSSDRYGFPEDAVTDNQAEAILTAAETFVSDLGWNSEIRFDIISVQEEDPGFRITHFEDAFG